MTIERWGDFALVDEGEKKAIPQEPGLADCGCDDDDSVGPWQQEGSETIATIEALARARSPYAESKLPSRVFGSSHLARIEIRRNISTREIVQVDLAYADGTGALEDWSDAAMHVFWSAATPRPLAVARHAQRLAVYGGNDIGRWIEPVQKIVVRGYEGLYRGFQANPPVTAESAKIPNAVQWFESGVFWTIQAYGSKEALIGIAESLQAISLARGT